VRAFRTFCFMFVDDTPKWFSGSRGVWYQGFFTVKLLQKSDGKVYSTFVLKIRKARSSLRAFQKLRDSKPEFPLATQLTTMSSLPYPQRKSSETPNPFTVPVESLGDSRARVQPKQIRPIVRDALKRAVEILQIDASQLSTRELFTPGRGGGSTIFIVRQMIAIRLRASRKHLSLPDIGRLMGGFHHTSILYMINHCPERERRLMLADIELAEERRKQEQERLDGPIDYTAWDEWI
jgi:hypothetical protein